MNTQEQTDYARIAEAITYLTANYKHQPTLEEVAEKVALSPFHFQRLFTEWAGVSPKKFLQFVTVNHAKRMLKNSTATLFDTAIETGLSGTGRLHDLFMRIEGMTPGEYKNGGENLAINYSFGETPFGTVLAASTAKGICHIAFADDAERAVEVLRSRHPRARYTEATDEMQQQAFRFFMDDWSATTPLQLHLKGSPFQLKVWETLLTIPSGTLVTYGSVADTVGLPNASRAVGTAIGDNPVAVLIPCHRIIRSTGLLGGYHWGIVRKQALIGWEAARLDAEFVSR